MQPLGKERFAKFSRTSIFRYKFAHRFHQSTSYSLVGVEGFVWALMLNHEFMCSDLNWGCPAAPLWAWYWAALVSLSLAWRMLKSGCEDSWLGGAMGTLSPAQGSGHPCSIHLTEWSVWREGEYTDTLFSVRTCGLPFTAGSSSRAELGCLLEPQLGLRPCRWEGCRASTLVGNFEFL